jgi:nucleotide-binding universal stress UspA family protein
VIIVISHLRMVFSTVRGLEIGLLVRRQPRPLLQRGQQRCAVAQRAELDDSRIFKLAATVEDFTRSELTRKICGRAERLNRPHLRRPMKTILCATDLSLRAALAVDRAVALARRHLARLLFLHVVDDDQPPAIVQAEIARARETLDARLTELKDHDGPGFETAVRAGAVFQTIVSTAEAEDADLVVMGAHRKRILRDVIVGTTLERVMRTGSRPVLMVNSATAAPYESVLLALDASEASALAVGVAKGLRLLEGARVAVVTAFEPIYKGMFAWVGVQESTITEYSETWARATRKEIEKLLQQAGLLDTSIDILTEEGPPFLVVKRVAAQLKPHLLVVGTHGRRGIKRALLGSVAEYLINQVECDVLAVPSGREG